MKIAVTYEDGQVFQHFGHTENFKIYDAENGKPGVGAVVSAAGSGHGALAGFLKGLGVQALICGGIGEGAKTALSQAGILLVAGASGDADAAVEAFLAGDLKNDPSVHCSHHDSHGEGHSCGEHGCGH